MMTEHLAIGDRVTFDGEKRAYTVRAVGERFVVCTKPFAAKRTVIYTVIDRADNIRSTEDLVFGFGAETDEQCQSMRDRLERNESGLSMRNAVPLQIDSVMKAA